MSVRVSKQTELRRMLAAVDALALEMKRKLRQKAREGYSGGLRPSASYNVATMLQEHVTRLTGVCPHCMVLDGDHDSEEAARQAIDVCNLAMMLWVMNAPPRSK